MICIGHGCMEKSKEKANKKHTLNVFSQPKSANQRRQLNIEFLAWKSIIHNYFQLLNKWNNNCCKRYYQLIIYKLPLRTFIVFIYNSSLNLFIVVGDIVFEHSIFFLFLHICE